MAYSVSIDRRPAYLRYVLLTDLKGISAKTKEILTKGWPFAKSDFGGGVQAITLLDMLDVDRTQLLTIPEIGPVRAEEILGAIEQGKKENFPYRIL